MTFINPICIINDDSKAFREESANGNASQRSPQPQLQEDKPTPSSSPPAPPPPMTTTKQQQKQYSSPSLMGPSFRKVGGKGGESKQQHQQRRPPPPPPSSPTTRGRSHHSYPQRQQEQHQWRPSMTAPCFTPQEEQEERDSLSNEEADYLQKEILGDNDTFIVDFESNNDVTICIQELKQYIDESISMIDKKEYLHAIQVCPHLVETETNPILFLRSENYNIKVRTARSKDTRGK